METRPVEDKSRNDDDVFGNRLLRLSAILNENILNVFRIFTLD